MGHSTSGRPAPGLSTPGRTTPVGRRIPTTAERIGGSAPTQRPLGARADATSRPPWTGVREVEVTVTGGPLGRDGRPLSPSARRMYQRRRRTMLLAFLLVSAVVLVVTQVTGHNRTTPTVGAPVPTSVGTTAPAVSAPAASPAKAPVAPTRAAQAPAASDDATAGAKPSVKAPSKAPSTALDRFSYVSSAGPILGTTGPVRRFRVAVEDSTGQGGADFAHTIDRVLGDPRSWIAAEQFRLVRVPGTSDAEFTVFLASAKTSETMCAAGGLSTAAYTSCRLPGQVIINLDRWKNAIPNYGAPLDIYQAYAINHEVGHQLGHGHELCPGAGLPAPVMQQQTYGLKGCVANPWPYVDGKRYAGKPVG
jgi:hypothetical protein